MQSIADLVLNAIGSQEVQKLSRQIDAAPDKTRLAVQSAVPMLVSALGKNVKSGGASNLLSALDQNHDGSILDDVAGAFGSHATSKDGAAIVDNILGNRRQAVEEGLSTTSGLGTSKIAKLLNLLAPLVMGSLGRTKREGGLDVQGLTQLLGADHDKADSQLGGLSSLLDSNKDGGVADDVLRMGSQFLKGRSH